MIDPEIDLFFSERKAAWLKKKIKGNNSDEEVEAFHDECDEVFSLENWLPDAAKRAGQISMASHPCTFSHPSARKNKNSYASSIIANARRHADGYLRAGNLNTSLDALGNAAALDVYGFLNLTMEDGESLIKHIQKETDLAKTLLTIKSKPYAELSKGFLAMIETSEEQITSSKIKQVYFPLGNGEYHLLSTLTNSGILFEARKRIDFLRFPDEEEKDKIKQAKEAKQKQLHHDHQWKEIWGLTTMGYGGTKPQNISVMNNKNGGRVHLFLSTPPAISKREIRFPIKDFFTESLNPYAFHDLFEQFHRLLLLDKNNLEIRHRRDHLLDEIIGKVIESVWAVRSACQEQFHDTHTRLPIWQKIWLVDTYTQRRTEDEWLDEVEINLTRWVINTYKKLLRKKTIALADAEYTYIATQIAGEREGIR